MSDMELAATKEVVTLVDEDISRRTIAVSMRAGKMSARSLAYALRTVGRKIARSEEHTSELQSP